MSRNQHTVTETVTNHPELELQCYIHSPRSQISVRLKDVVDMAMEQHAVNNGLVSNRSQFIEQAVVTALGGTMGVARLIREALETKTRRAKLSDESHQGFYIDPKTFQIVEEKTDY